MAVTLVTGATGFIGSHIVERLIERGHEVRALARKSSDISHLKTTNARIFFGDVEDYDSLLPAVKGVDIVYHAAARVMPGWGAWKWFEASIIKGTDNMLKASAEAGVPRFLHLSTGTVHGRLCEGDMPLSESMPCGVVFSPDSYYDYAKVEADKIAFDYHKKGKIQVSMIRIGVTYGPRDRLLADRVYRQMLSPIVVWPGQSDPKYSIVYVTDAADLAILAATSDRAQGEVYNVADSQPVRLHEFAAAILRAMGETKPQLTIPYPVAYVSCALMETWSRLRRAKEMPYLTRSGLHFVNKGIYLDGTKARVELGWQPKVSLEEGTRRYVQWRRKQSKK
ncbi:MAG: NAD-dependent epimerase/dehydratase family protein [Chloroflexi bacterium]|nr:NAD-dependent epimerase/dehydratase family protein [Chloroflexota bacterium]